VLRRGRTDGVNGVSGHFRIAFEKTGTASIITGCALTASLSLSIPQVAALCFDSCAEAHDWTLFGTELSWIGVGFFAFCLLLLFLKRFTYAEFGLHTLLAGACGAEIAFLYVQGVIIGKWCPVCVAIAFLVYVAAISLVVSGLVEGFRGNPGGKIMRKQTGKGALFLAVALAGWCVALAGLENPRQAEASTAGMMLEMGNRDSHIEVYVFSDVFCPACRRAEPELEKVYPEISDSCKVVFVDFPLYKESMNFSPYALSFAVHEKPRYMEARKALVSLATQTRTPTPEDVQRAVSPIGITYRPLDYSDVVMLLRHCSELAGSMEVDRTPTMVILNRKTNVTKKLVGTGELTRDNILSEISRIRAGE
jgi:hypothetical protein